MEWVDGTYRITSTGWKDCVAVIHRGKIVECNFPLTIGVPFIDLFLWFVENTPSRGVMIRRES